MRSDHTATELAPPQPPLPTSLDAAGEGASRRQIGTLARVTFCFAWLFGLEPFLTNPTDSESRAKLDRH
jgi:hypothetical protein